MYVCMYVYCRMEGLQCLWQEHQRSRSCYGIMVRFCCYIPIIPAAVLCISYYDVSCYVFGCVYSGTIGQHSPGSSSRRKGCTHLLSAWCHCSAPGLRSTGTAAAHRRSCSAQLICFCVFQCCRWMGIPCLHWQLQHTRVIWRSYRCCCRQGKSVLIRQISR